MPANAQRMATICVDLMTSKLIDPRAVFQRSIRSVWRSF